MNTIDQHVVSMQFNNKQFESNAKQTMTTLQQLKQSLDFHGSEERLTQLYNRGQMFNLDGIAQGVQSLSDRFSTLGIVGMTVIQDLTNVALKFGKKLVGFLWDPLVEGGRTRSEAIEQAKFQFKGLGMDVEATMESALKAVKGTAYGLGEAALVAAQLGASGMRAGKDMSTALRGVAGVAAMTSSSYADIGNIFITVAGNGRLMGDQLRQLSYKGINAAATLAKYLGKTEGQIREMVTKGQIDFKTFSDAMDSAFGEHAQDANKLFSGALANMRAALSRIGAEIWTPKLEAYRDILNALTPIIDQIHERLMPLIEVFNEFQRAIANTIILKLNWFEKFNKQYKFLDTIVEGLRVNFITFQIILETVGKAFRDVFPKASTYNLITFAHKFEELAESLMVLATDEVLAKIRKIFKGFFSVIKFGIDLVITLARAAWGLAQGLAPLGRLIFNLTAGFGTFISGLQESASHMNLFEKTVYNCNQIGESFGRMLGNLDKIIPFFTRVAEGLARVVGGIFKGMAQGINELNIEKTVKLINGILTGVLLKNLANWVQNLNFMTKRGGPFAGFVGIFDELKGSLLRLQGQIKAEALMKIAIAVGVLVASMAVLASLDPAKLLPAMTALSGLMTEVAIAMLFLGKMGPMGFKALISLSVMASAMQTLSVAVLILSFALKNLAKLSWGDIIKGLIAIKVLVGVLIASVKILEKNQAGLGKVAFSFILFAVAIRALATAVKAIGTLSLDVVAKGIGGIALLMASLVIFSRKVKDALSVKASLALIFLAISINGLVLAIKGLASVSWQDLGKGLIGLAGMLVELGIFLRLIGDPGKVMASGVALTFIATAMIIMVQVMKAFSKMTWEEIGKGLGTLAGALLIIGGAMLLMKTALPGAAALVLIAAALAILAPVLVILGSLSIDKIVTALGTLAATFAIFGLAAMVLTPVLPSMLMLAGAIALLGAGCALAGLGLMAISAGLIGLAAAGAGGTAAMVMFVTSMSELIPMVAKNLAMGFVEFGKTLATNAKTIIFCIVTILSAVIDALITLVPKALEFLGIFITESLKFLVTVIPAFVEAGAQIIVGVLQGIAQNIGGIVSAAVSVAVNFIEALAKKLPDVIQAGFDFVIAFINGVADSIRENNQAVIDATWNLLDAFVDAGIQWLASAPKGLWDIGKGIVGGIIDGMKGKEKEVSDTGKAIGTRMVRGVRQSLGINSPSKEFKDIGKYSMQGLVAGIKESGSKVLSEAKTVGTSLLTTIQNAMSLAGGSFDLMPTIRPVLDLTDVEKGSSRLTGMLADTGISANGSMVSAGNISQVVTGETPASIQNGGNIEYSFVQNNYSPKALSRLDIYRQTKNQFSAMKGMVSG